MNQTSRREREREREREGGEIWREYPSVNTVIGSMTSVCTGVFLVLSLYWSVLSLV